MPADPTGPYFVVTGVGRPSSHYHRDRHWPIRSRLYISGTTYSTNRLYRTRPTYSARVGLLLNCQWFGTTLRLHVMVRDLCQRMPGTYKIQ